MGRTRHAIEQLRMAIDCLPVDTRVAMLEGVRSNEIIVGAYTDSRGGVCPMLAAHRCGGRTDFITFARSWDRFTGAKGRARHASERELRVLNGHLEASLLAEDHVDTALDRAIAEHRELLARVGRVNPTGQRAGRIASSAQPRFNSPRPSDSDRSRELRQRPGWAWLRPFRRLDGYERAIARVETERAALREEGADRELTGVG